MKTVLHLIDTTGPGGAETVFTDLVRGLPRDRYRSIPLITGPGWVEDTLTTDGNPPITVQGKQRGRLLSDLMRIIRRENVDIIHAHLIGSALYGSVASKLSGRPSVCTFHGPADLPDGDRFRAVRFGLIGAAASHVSFVSESLRKWVVAATPLSMRKTSVIYNGVDTSRFENAEPAPLRRELGLPDGLLLMGALGNVRAPKGYAHLMDALARLSVDTPWHFVIVGDTSGDVYPRVLRRRDELGLSDRVTFVGFREDVPSVLRSLDVFVLSSLTEGFSLATVQALASGLPVIATACGGPEEILRDGTGILVPPSDAAAMADALQRVLVDARLRARLAGAGRRDVEERFSMRSMIGAYTALYESL